MFFAVYFDLGLEYLINHSPSRALDAIASRSSCEYEHSLPGAGQELPARLVVNPVLLPVEIYVFYFFDFRECVAPHRGLGEAPGPADHLRQRVAVLPDAIRHLLLGNSISQHL